MMTHPPSNPFSAAIARAMANTPSDGHREPTEFEKAVLYGLQVKSGIFQNDVARVIRQVPAEVYQGYAGDRVIVHPDGSETLVPDPRIAQVERRRAKNRVGRKSRRINRIWANA
ncbi:hypothetical protein SEA_RAYTHEFIREFLY_54 [Gordonia phage RayTheFireFly]|nr:hypothetical protein SEA_RAYTHEFIREFLY_54 [Gordonia phage RayTheFireFly]